MMGMNKKQTYTKAMEIWVSINDGGYGMLWHHLNK